MAATAAQTLQPPAVDSPAPQSAREATRRQMKGSSLLLLGRILSMGVNFGVQIMIVRYLSPSDYGGLIYAFTIVDFLGTLATFGLCNGVSRFAPVYVERKDRSRLLGLIVFVAGGVLLGGGLVIAGIYAAPALVERVLAHSGASKAAASMPADMLRILVFLVPLEALDGLCIELFASFSEAKAIFLRRHLLASLLKIVVVLPVLLMHGGVMLLAECTLAAGIAGVVVNASVLLKLLRRQGMLEQLDLRKLQLPVREVLGFTLPLLTADLAFAVIHSASILILGYFHDTSQVAAYRVILPVANLNTMVVASFAVMYMPLLASLHEKGDEAGVNALYWRTAAWMTVITFPIFAVTAGLSRPLTSWLFGARYESSWVSLQLLSTAYYIGVALGFSALTLRIRGRTRFAVIADLLTMVLVLILDFLLVPRYGALGAAIGTTCAIVLHGLVTQGGLRLISGVSVFDMQYTFLYMVVAAGAGTLWLLERFVTSSLFVLVPAAGLVSLAVLRLARRNLDVENTFPELLRLPLLGALLRSNPRPVSASPLGGRPRNRVMKSRYNA